MPSGGINDFAIGNGITRAMIPPAAQEPLEEGKGNTQDAFPGASA
jgi:hypothetical protein